MSKVIDFHRHSPHFVVLALCLPCGHRWIGITPVAASLLTLECPSCGAQESFASLLPPDYLNHCKKETVVDEEE